MANKYANCLRQSILSCLVGHNLGIEFQNPHKARIAQIEKWSENCEGGQVVDSRMIPVFNSRPATKRFQKGIKTVARKS